MTDNKAGDDKIKAQIAEVRKRREMVRAFLDGKPQIMAPNGRKAKLAVTSQTRKKLLAFIADCEVVEADLESMLTPRPE